MQGSWGVVLDLSIFAIGATLLLVKSSQFRNIGCRASAASQLLSRETHANSHRNPGSCPSPVYPSCWTCATRRQFQPALKQIKTTHCVPELQPGAAAHGTSAKIFRKEWQPLGERHKRKCVKRWEDTQDGTVKRWRDTLSDVRGENGETERICSRRLLKIQLEMPFRKEAFHVRGGTSKGRQTYVRTAISLKLCLTWRTEETGLGSIWMGNFTSAQLWDLGPESSRELLLSI